MSKVLLIGNFGSGNIGDECILKCALDLYGASKCIVMTNDPEFSQKFCGVDFETIPFPPTAFRSWIRFLIKRGYSQDLLSIRQKSIDQVVFPGGGLFAIKIRAVLLWAQVFIWVKFLFPTTKIIFEHQGVDRMSPVAMRIIKWVFGQASKVSVRDSLSGKALASLKMCRYEQREDRVFEVLKKLYPTPPLGKKKKGLLNALEPVSGAQFSLMTKQYPDYEWAYICFDPQDKKKVPAFFKGSIYQPQTWEETEKIFQEASVVIGERLHVLIWGFVLCGARNTFTLQKPYSQKVESFVLKNNISKL